MLWDERASRQIYLGVFGFLLVSLFGQ
ncbi:hypothetical protein [Sagittula sp. SSi028]